MSKENGPIGSVKLSLHEQQAVVEVAGEIDLATAPELRMVLGEGIEASRGPLVIDLSDTEFIDSTGISALLGALRRLNEAQRALILVVGTRSVQRVLALAGLDCVFTIVEARKAS